MLSAATLTTSILLTVLAIASSQGVDAWWFSSMASPGQQAPPTPPPQPTKAVANFDMDGVKGSFTFSQKSANEPTLIEYDIHGLKGNNKLYHVHVQPVPAFDAEQVRNNLTLIGQLCGDPSTGGHLNPHHVTAKLPPKSAPLDQYETGDLSGKHGPMVQVPGHEDHYAGSFTDGILPLSGPNSIIGRSVVIHKNDSKRWVCASINAV